MADTILKRWNETTEEWEELNPQTTHTQIVASGTPDNTTYLRGDGTWATVASSFDGGTITGNIEISNTLPKITLTDTNNNSDFHIANNNGTLEIADTTNQLERVQITSNGDVILPASGGLTLVDKAITNSNGALLWDGDEIYHAGNLTPSDYVAKAGDTMTGELTIAPTSGVSKLNINAVSGQNSQILLKEAGTLKSAITYVAGNDKLAFYHEGADRLTIDSSGNVGIGTTSPSSKLHIVGDTRIEGDLTVNGTYTQIDTNTNTTEQWIVTNDGTGPAAIINQIGAHPVLDVQDDGVSALYVADGGNVGIGTTSPSSKLTIESSTATAGDAVLNIRTTPGNITAGSTAIGGIYFSTQDASGGGTGDVAGITVIAGDGTSAYTGAGRPADLVFYTQPLGASASLTEAMRIDQDGNVGIGTTSPQSKLHIENGFARTSTSDNTISLQTSTDTDAYRVGLKTSLIGGASAGVRTLVLQSGANNSGDGTFGNSGERLSLNPNGGNVGIGTDNPTGKLTVFGETHHYDSAGVKYINSDPRWAGDTGRLHIWATTAAGATYGSAGLALWDGDSYHTIDSIGNKILIDGNEAWHAGNLTNLNQLTNGPGYITSADGGDATTLDGYDSSNFKSSVRHDFRVPGDGDKFYKVTITMASSWARGFKIYRGFSESIGTTSNSGWNGGSTTHFGALEITGVFSDNDWGGSLDTLNYVAEHRYTVVCGRLVNGSSSEYTKLIAYLRGAPGTGALYHIEIEDNFNPSASVAVDTNTYISSADTEWNSTTLSRQNFKYSDIYNGTNKVFHDGYHPNADKLTTARNIALTGDVTGNADFDGSGNISITATVGNDSHTHDTRYYTKSQTDTNISTAVSNLVDSSPATLDTLNELAAALNDDANFATTITNSIATKVSKSGDTMTGDLLFANGANRFIRFGSATNYFYQIGSVNDDFQINEAGSTNNRFTIKYPNGNVGIGTTSPATKLQVNGNVLLGSTYVTPVGSPWNTTNAQLILGGAHNAEFNNSDSVKLLITGHNNDSPTNMYPILVEDENGYDDFWLKARASASSGATMYLDGNFGIGTTSPSRKLQVGSYSLSGQPAPDGNADIVSTGGIVVAAGKFVSYDGAYSIHAQQRYNTSGVSDATFEHQGYYGHNFQTRDNQSRMVIIGATGNVGIGTTSPTEKLDVNGNVKVSGSLTVVGSIGKPLTYTTLGSITMTTGSVTMSTSPSNGLDSIVTVEIEAFNNAGPATWTGPLNAISTTATYKNSLYLSTTKYGDFYRNSTGTQIYFSSAPANTVYSAKVYELKVD